VEPGPAAETEAAARKAAREVDDAWVLSKIKGQLVTEEDVDANAVDVSVDKGVVTLRGTVDSQAERTRALEIARNTEGVKRVMDELSAKMR
jgi:hyperosmotically inducible protein